MTDKRLRDKKQWWYLPTLRGIVFKYGAWPGPGWLPSSRKDKP